MSKYKHILLDVDGTLIDTYHANVSSLKEILERYMPGHHCTEQDYADIFGIPERDGLRMLKAPEEQIERMAEDWVALVRTKSNLFCLFDGVIELLERLKEQGYHTYLITSRTRGVSQGGPLGSWEPEPLRAYVGGAICANDVKRPKPAPDSILLYMEKTGAKKEEILFVGDTHTDLQCAQSAGVDFGLALWGYCGKQQLECQHYFKHPNDILALLQG